MFKNKKNIIIKKNFVIALFFSSILTLSFYLQSFTARPNYVSEIWINQNKDDREINQLFLSNLFNQENFLEYFKSYSKIKLSEIEQKKIYENFFKNLEIFLTNSKNEISVLKIIHTSEQDFDNLEFFKNYILYCKNVSITNLINSEIKLINNNINLANKILLNKGKPKKDEDNYEKNIHIINNNEYFDKTKFYRNLIYMKYDEIQNLIFLEKNKILLLEEKLVEIKKNIYLEKKEILNAHTYIDKKSKFIAALQGFILSISLIIIFATVKKFYFHKK